MSDFSWDLSEFHRSLPEIMRGTKKTEAEILNRAGLVTVIGGRGVRGAIQRTPVADKAKIEAVPRRVLLAAVIKRAKRKGQWPLSSAEVNKRVKAEKAQRIRARAYTRGPGWNKAAQAMGGRGVRGLQSGYLKSRASKGFGTRAKPSALVVEIANTAPAADKIGREALQDALNDTARDMVEHSRAKLQKTFDRHSAK